MFFEIYLTQLLDVFRIVALFVGAEVVLLGLLYGYIYYSNEVTLPTRLKSLSKVILILAGLSIGLLCIPTSKTVILNQTMVGIQSLIEDYQESVGSIIDSLDI